MEFPFKATVPLLIERLQDKIKTGITDMIVDYISVTPILVGVSIGVYALCSMFSKRIANLSILFVFGYGFLITIY